MLAELEQSQAESGITFVYVTQDQGESLAMRDRVAVMNRGLIMQLGPLDDIMSGP